MGNKDHGWLYGTHKKSGRHGVCKDVVLEMWVRGVKTKTIALFMGIGTERVVELIAHAREEGDERAVYRRR